MTNGDYVFFGLNLGTEGSDWGFVQWQKGDEDDEVLAIVVNQ
ncbi:hypothetical protein RvY_08337 [Ramazzottius varieornatus]|uniref:Uncharacterized protein n=1 Tax=Ramazzottius varieornatus TaxID=947166 RepID=A0A1D1V5H3_RAMVA|nr:hypothetical protein RvY_08337 [Ramazzottius varieornatus]